MNQSNVVGRRTISKSHDVEQAVGLGAVVLVNRRGIGSMVARGAKLTGHEVVLDDARTAKQAIGRARVDARTAAHSAREAINYVRIATRSPLAREPQMLVRVRPRHAPNPVLHNRAIGTGAGTGLFIYGSRSD